MPDDEIVRALLKDVSDAENRAQGAKTARDDAIRRAKDAGASYAQIARASGMTRPGVQAVIRRGH